MRLDEVADQNFAYWHSATFNNDGTKVIFTDEWGGGTAPRCRATDLPTWGADAIFDIVDKKLQFGGYYKMPAAQTEQENCVAHNGSLIPVPGRDIMVQAWYQGGVSVFDFTDSAQPVEIAFFDRGPIDAKNLIVGGYWSAYWYNGNIYGSGDLARHRHLQAAAERVPVAERDRRRDVDPLGASSTPRRSRRSSGRQRAGLARALGSAQTGSKGITAAARPGGARRDRCAPTASHHRQGAHGAPLSSTSSTPSRLARGADASAALGHDAMRFKALAATIKGRTAKLR